MTGVTFTHLTQSAMQCSGPACEAAWQCPSPRPSRLRNIVNGRDMSYDPRGPQGPSLCTLHLRGTAGPLASSTSQPYLAHGGTPRCSEQLTGPPIHGLLQTLKQAAPCSAGESWKTPHGIAHCAVPLLAPTIAVPSRYQPSLARVDSGFMKLGLQTLYSGKDSAGTHLCPTAQWLSSVQKHCRLTSHWGP